MTSSGPREGNQETAPSGDKALSPPPSTRTPTSDSEASASLRPLDDHYLKLAAAVASLEARAAAQSEFERERSQTSQTRWMVFVKASRTLAASIMLLVIGNFVTSCFQMKSEKSRQLFAARLEIYKAVSTGLGSLETDARKLQWDIADAETQPDLLDAERRQFVDRSGDILERLQALPFPPDWQGTETDDWFAVQHAWYTVYALMACLDNGSGTIKGSTRSLKDEVAQALSAGKLDSRTSKRLLVAVTDRPPCSENFHHEVFQSLRAHVATAEWRLLTSDPVSRIF
jgi:hypothetical protein